MHTRSRSVQLTNQLPLQKLLGGKRQLQTVPLLRAFGRGNPLRRLRTGAVPAVHTVKNRSESLWLCHRAADDHLQPRTRAAHASELLQELILVTAPENTPLYRMTEGGWEGTEICSVEH